MNEPSSVAPTKKGWLKWVALGCVGLLLLGCALAAAIVWVSFGAMKRSEAAQLALERARAHPEVVEALGEPIEVGWLMGGSISVTGPSGEARLSIPLAGPRAEGTLFLEAVKRAGRWELTLLELAPEGGEQINLLADDAPL
jgi:hypothetical protein